MFKMLRISLLLCDTSIDDHGLYSTNTCVHVSKVEGNRLHVHTYIQAGISVVSTMVDTGATQGVYNL